MAARDGQRSVQEKTAVVTGSWRSLEASMFLPTDQVGWKEFARLMAEAYRFAPPFP